MTTLFNPDTCGFCGVVTPEHREDCPAYGKQTVRLDPVFGADLQPGDVIDGRDLKIVSIAEVDGKRIATVRPLRFWEGILTF